MIILTGSRRPRWAKYIGFISGALDTCLVLWFEFAKLYGLNSCGLMPYDAICQTEW